MQKKLLKMDNLLVLNLFKLMSFLLIIHYNDIFIISVKINNLVIIIYVKQLYFFINVKVFINS